jgi:hypothetical protein
VLACAIAQSSPDVKRKKLSHLTRFRISMSPTIMLHLYYLSLLLIKAQTCAEKSLLLIKAQTCAGKLDLDHTYTSIERFRFTCSPHPKFTAFPCLHAQLPSPPRMWKGKNCLTWLASALAREIRKKRPRKKRKWPSNYGRKKTKITAALLHIVPRSVSDRPTMTPRSRRREDVVSGADAMDIAARASNLYDP